MKIPSQLKNLKSILDSNSPVILTGMAVSGACLTAYLAAKGGYKASQHMGDKDPQMPNNEKFIETYKFYIPAAAALVGTSTCMVLATKIGLDRTAAMAGAFVVAERANDQYREKVKEILGENKHVKVTDAVASEQVKSIPTPPNVSFGDQEQLFFDRWSGRYFPSSMEKMNRAVNDFNHEMLYGHYNSLSSFYNRIGLEETQESDDIGWNKESLLELVYTTVLKDDKAVIAYEFDRKPMPNFQDGDI